MRRTTAAALAAALLAIALVGCNNSYQGKTPPPTINADLIMQEYRFNEDRANQRYENRWFTVSAGPVTKVRGGDRVRVRYQGKILSMYFPNGEDTRNIDLNQQITAVCKIQGPTRYAHLFMNGCHWPIPAK